MLCVACTDQCSDELNSKHWQTCVGAGSTVAAHASLGVSTWEARARADPLLHRATHAGTSGSAAAPRYTCARRVPRQQVPTEATRTQHSSTRTERAQAGARFARIQPWAKGRGKPATLATLAVCYRRRAREAYIKVTEPHRDGARSFRIDCNVSCLWLSQSQSSKPIRMGCRASAARFALQEVGIQCQKMIKAKELHIFLRRTHDHQF